MLYWIYSGQQPSYVNVPMNNIYSSEPNAYPSKTNPYPTITFTSQPVHFSFGKQPANNIPWYAI